jgi:hypothetical protein
MKNIEDLNKSKVPIVAIDPSLGKYRDKTPFPKKLAKAGAMLKNVKLPAKKQNSK